MTTQTIRRTYLTLSLFNTLANSFIWGVNTLFLLEAGLTKTEAFAANSFFTVGMVLCDIPTGVIADTWGRRYSYLVGCLTLMFTTLVYYFLWRFHCPFWAWAVDSMLLGLGFTFFSGATDAWVVDALHSLKFEGSLESVFAQAQIIDGVAMFIGATLGGVVAQYTNLGVPYLIRSGFLLVSFGVAAAIMRDLGFTPRAMKNIADEARFVIKRSIDGGLRVPAVRWVMLIAPVTSGISIYGFYAAQPYLLELYGKTNDYSIAGIAASLVAVSQIAGGLSVPLMKKIFKKRTSIFAAAILGSSIFLCCLGLSNSFWPAIICLGLWGLLSAAMIPQRQAYLNHCIDSESRATILSFDNTLGSMGGVVIQPVLGRTADVWSFAFSFVVASIIQLVALPFVVLARRQKSQADNM
jgi:MFS family permease